MVIIIKCEIITPVCQTQSAGCQCCRCLSTMEEVELVRVTSRGGEVVSVEKYQNVASLGGEGVSVEKYQNVASLGGEGVSVEEYQNVSSGADYVDASTPKPGDVEASQRHSGGCDGGSISGSQRTSLKDGEHYYIVPEPKNINISTNKNSCSKPSSSKTAVDLEMDEESYLMPNPRRKSSARSRKVSVEKKRGAPVRKTSRESDVPDEEAPALPTHGRRNRQDDYAKLDVKSREEEHIYTHLKEPPPKLPKRLLRRITANSVLVFCSFLLCITLCSLLYFYVNSLVRQERQTCQRETQNLWNEMEKLRNLANCKYMHIAYIHLFHVICCLLPACHIDCLSASLSAHLLPVC